MERDTYDLVIVGAGSAGCVLADRLSRHAGAEVLVIEAGGERVPAETLDPISWPRRIGSALDWRYRTVPQRGLSSRTVAEPRGRVLGGTSSLNAMIYTRGHPADFDGWAHAGAPGWRHADLLRWFRRIEDAVDDAGEWYGHGGPVQVRNAGRRGAHPVSAAFIDACGQAGFGRAEFNGPGWPKVDPMLGADWFRVNLDADGHRAGAAQAYLQPALGRVNLTLTAGAQATGLTFAGDRCTGVTYRHDGVVRTARARSEVVLACGTVESPKLLMLSGIGDPTELGRHGIAVRQALPGVGANLHDHAFVRITVPLRRPAPPLARIATEAGLFFQTRPGWVGPDAEIVCGLTHLADGGTGPPAALTLSTAVVRPMSRGRVRLDRPEPGAPPLIDPAFLTAAADVDGLVAACRTALDVVAQPALAAWVDGQAVDIDVSEPSTARAAIRGRALGQWHLAGSCRMGLDTAAVVDEALRVHGVTGLRVVDASVMPRVVSAHCQAAVFAIAERAAALIALDHGFEGPGRGRADGG
jgi:choline dehydrogenase